MADWKPLAFVVLAALLAPPAAGQLLISEFRTHGPSGGPDEYVEILNNSGTDHTVAAASGTGYGIAASDGTTRCTIPNGLLIPAHGHFLCANSVGYSLGGYPAGNGTTATADASYTTNIPDNAGIALFNNNLGGGSYSLPNRLDAVGSTSEANTLYKEGTGYPALDPSLMSTDHALLRDACGKGGVVSTPGPCPRGGGIADTDINAADFYFVDTNAIDAGFGQRLGAPAPENLSSPRHGTSPLGSTALDPCAANLAAPNFVHDTTPDPPNNSGFGTLDFRRTFTNNTGVALTRLRFRIIDQGTFPAPSGFADLRARSSTATTATVDRVPCGGSTSVIAIHSTTLETPPAQPNGGALGSSFAATAVSVATPLAPGASIDLRFLFGIQQNGSFHLTLIAETLPAASNTLFYLTDAPGFAKGDFNGDGYADILFTNVGTGTQNKVWFMQGKTRIGEVPVTPDAPSADWRIRGADDFNADGKNDLVFWNQATGNVEFWLLTGATRLGPPMPLMGGSVLPLNWKLSATADFNHDGKPDLVWRNVSSQKIVVWTMNGVAKVANIVPSPDQAVNFNWTIVAAADYNHDGNTDFLWYNETSGKVVTWYMNPSAVRISGQFTNPDAAGDFNWKVAASADFSGTDSPGTPPAGSPDILWRNETSGNQVVWHLDFASSRVHSEFTEPHANTPPLDWTIVGPR